MFRQTLITLIAITIVVSWAYVVFVRFREDAPHLMAIAMVVPIALSGMIVYLQFSSLPGTRIGSIIRLSKDIEMRINQSLEPIDERIAPIEIRPLINSINRLIDYKEDRYLQERDFTANASHELRTPLAGVRIQTQIAMRTNDDNQRQQALLNIIHAVDRGTRLVEQLLILSRLTADRVELEKENISLGKIAALTVADLLPIAKEKQINLNMGAWNEDDKVFVNNDSISILIQNLILNSIIYTPIGGDVDVEIFSSIEGVGISVNDTGPGIPAEKRDLVMERFRKAEKVSKTGTGLGLAIVKRIADLHHTSLFLQDGKNGVGLKASIIFKKSEELA